MPHATKKPRRPRPNATLSAPVSYPTRAQQSNQSSSSGSSSAHSHSHSHSQSNSYTWTAADAAKASRDGAFLTAWPRDETYYAPPIHLFDQTYQSYQGYQNQGQGQNQSQSQGNGAHPDLQYYYSSGCKSSTTPNQGGSSK
ncbi:hypothetical protein F4677DRAFT_93161 [Hypoxylon crocopeplum]|nr:hypothetical protein F4677DRAFT_93161 [Hypoxylon crocopeplum]